MRYISDKARRLVAEKHRQDMREGFDELRGWDARALAAPVFAISPEDWHVWASNGKNRPGDYEGLMPASPCWIECAGVVSVFLFQIDDRPYQSFYAFDGLGFWFEGDRVAGEKSRWRFEIYKDSLQARSPRATDEIHQVAYFSWELADCIARFENVAQERALSAGRKMHARKGRGRVFRHYEIDLSNLVKTQTAANHGGTHAPPAWHIRRGHIRRLKDGRTVFVRSCEVGDKERGVVLKDYRVGEGVARPEHSR